MSPHGFLYNSKQDVVLKYIVRLQPFTEVLRLVRDCIVQLDIGTEDRDTLQHQLDQADLMQISGDGWSRTEMASLWAIDQTLSRLTCLEGLPCLAIKMLYMHEQDFRTGLLSEPTPGFGDANCVVFDLEQDTVQLSNVGQSQPSVFLFSPTAAFVENHKRKFDTLLASASNRQLKIPLADCRVACFGAHVRATMWKMSLSSKGLHDLRTDSSTRAIYNIACDVAIVADGDDVSDKRDTDVAESDASQDIRRRRSLSASWSATRKPRSFRAADEGSSSIAQLLLNKGADANAQSGDHGSALQAASHAGYADIVKVLLCKGADIDAHGGQYGTALQAAIIGGHEEIVQLLLDHGANINAEGGHYGNALYIASWSGQT